ncbi:SAM-dependent chlorinase/fluorinase [Plectonema radiosum NIES-515]|uniref:SAM-dependent chlorinase/fluorinase n=1 Tax=Plectonema radiosum NIES-515 TaxID=2986073 RepID=A0ABT3AW58_9CYAN|nr:SAM-dependent chlorinase/fluorinase [Plectonema radiosum]MCV3213348.1 SAM-dependent chlorinase/fluorinase [Plectonema radiosum NIES-515]
MNASAYFPNKTGCETYADVLSWDAIALIGSHGWVEIAINSGNAQLQLQLQLADAVVFLSNKNPDFSNKSEF